MELKFPILVSNSAFLLGAAPAAAEAVTEMDGGGGGAIRSSRQTEEAARASCRRHSEAERKRRQRINGHLATLRSLVPAAARMDKATLLAEVVRHVRELRGRAGDAEVGEGDEVGLAEEEEGGGRRRVRAWVCCADRPGLMGELSRAVRSVPARAVRAEMATVGGRTRSVLELELVGVEGAEEGRSALQAALWAVLLANGHGSVGTVGEKQKRPRLSTRFTTT